MESALHKPALVTAKTTSKEVPVKWNKWVRQIHRWLSIAYTLAVIVNIVAILKGRYSATVGLLAVAPLAFQFITGLYLFVLPYAAKWSSEQRSD